MENVYVGLPSPAVVQRFVETLTKLDGDFDLISGKYILDARSLMGIFSLDISKPIQLRIHNNSDENMEAIYPYMVKSQKGASVS